MAQYTVYMYMMSGAAEGAGYCAYRHAGSRE